MKDDRDESYIGDTSLKIYNYLKSEQINFHVDKDTKCKCNKILKQLKKNGINTSPDAGVFFVNITYLVSETFFNDAERLGIDPIKYSYDRLKTILDNIDKPEKEIKTVENIRKNAVKDIDSYYSKQANAVVE